MSLSMYQVCGRYVQEIRWWQAVDDTMTRTRCEKGFVSRSEDEFLD